jgi:hypothetical protein
MFCAFRHSENPYLPQQHVAFEQVCIINEQNSNEDVHGKQAHKPQATASCIEILEWAYMSEK